MYLYLYVFYSFHLYIFIYNYLCIRPISVPRYVSISLRTSFTYYLARIVTSNTEIVFFFFFFFFFNKQNRPIFPFAIMKQCNERGYQKLAKLREGYDEISRCRNWKMANAAIFIFRVLFVKYPDRNHSQIWNEYGTLKVPCIF